MTQSLNPADIPMEAVTPSEYVEIMVKHMIPADQPVMLWGDPGVGKSDLGALVAKLALEDRFIPFHLGYYASVDLRGIPDKRNGRTIWLPPDIFPDEKRDGPVGSWFFDEITNAAPAVQPVAYQIVLEGRCAGYTKPARWYVSAAGNMQSSRAGANRMSTALATRFIHFQLIVSAGNWCTWALAAGVDARTIAYIRLRPEMLHAFDAHARTHPNPRTWTMVDKAAVRSGMEGALLHKTLCGGIGAGAGTEFYGFLQSFPDVNPDAVLLNPDAAKLPPPDKPDQCFAVCGALANAATAANFDRVIRYADRLPADFATALVRCATTRDETLVNTSAFVAWTVKNGATAAQL